MSSIQASKSREIGLKSIQTIQAAHTSNDVNQKASTEATINELSAELQELTDKKQRLIEQTKNAIDEEKHQWKTEKKAYVEAAKMEGYEAGFKAGKTASMEQYQTLIEKANAIVLQTEKDYHKEMEQNSESIVQIAVYIAEKILQETLEKHPESFISIVKAVLQELKDSGRITIYLHPDNYEYVFQQKEELTRLLEETKKISIYVKETLAINSCIIEHPYGQIDASVDTQLEQIRSTLLEIASGSNNGTK